MSLKKSDRTLTSFLRKNEMGIPHVKLSGLQNLIARRVIYDRQFLHHKTEIAWCGVVQGYNHSTQKMEYIDYLKVKVSLVYAVSSRPETLSLSSLALELF